ncbi:uncharacterized protein [Rutidosis leptorrhynchoides]|uniref:uncharacterized protein n=1 Tax=Rutidosis leptorrhynchoides TaxID=125765 RepID=UPI003A99ECA1
MSIHGEGQGTDLPCFLNASGTWASICKSINMLHTEYSLDTTFLLLKIGNGTNAKFWYDPWINDSSLASCYPRLLALDTNNSSSVASRYNNNGWLFFWRRDPRYGIEVENLQALNHLFSSISITSESDYWTWEGGTFSVSKVRKLIDNHDLARFSIATKWCKQVPIKINIFVWRLKLSRLATKVNLSARGIVLEEAGCCLCDESFEDENHLFLHCATSQQIWSKISQWSNISLPSWSSLANLWAWIDGVPIPQNRRLITSIIIYATLWNIWRLRNSVIFDDKSFRKCHVIDSIVTTSFNWIFARVRKKNCNWNQWLQSPLLSL